MESIIFRPIGLIHSPHKEPHGTPIQPSAAIGIEGQVEIYNDFAEGLSDLEDFSHVILLYHFHRAKAGPLKLKPFMDKEERGVFATRAPRRPNAIGLSIVKLLRVKGNVLHIADVDILDGTPLLDIKPYVPEFDHREQIKIGWLEKNVKKLSDSKDDGRFIE